MTQAAVEQVRHAHERGDILRTLKEDYRAEMTATWSLVGALDAQGVSLSMEDLTFHLEYLAEQEYVRIWRQRDLPGARRDRRAAGWRAPATIIFAKLLPKGLQLMDGKIAEDPLVSF